MTDEERLKFAKELSARILPTKGERPQYRFALVVCMLEECDCGAPDCDGTAFTTPTVATNMEHGLLCRAMAASTSELALRDLLEAQRPLRELDS